MMTKRSWRGYEAHSCNPRNSDSESAPKVCPSPPGWQCRVVVSAEPWGFANPATRTAGIPAGSIILGHPSGSLLSYPVKYAFPPLSAARVLAFRILAVALGSICSANRLLFAGFTATMATSDFSQLYIIGFEFPLLSFAAPHDSVAVERPLRSR